MRWNDLRTRQFRSTNLSKKVNNPKIKCIFSFREEVCEIYYQRAFILFPKRHKYILTQTSEQVLTVPTTMVFSYKTQKESSNDRPDHFNNLDSIPSSQPYKMTSSNGIVCGNLNREAMFGSYAARVLDERPYLRTPSTGQLSIRNQLPLNVS